MEDNKGFLKAVKKGEINEGHLAVMLALAENDENKKGMKDEDVERIAKDILWDRLDELKEKLELLKNMK